MNWYFFGWRDTIEIIFFSSVFYGFSLWLKADRQKNLLGYFYLYCMCAFGAHYLQLTTISTFLLMTAPATIALFITLHQQVLQRNFITLKNIRPVMHNTGNWIETLIRGCLVAMNKNNDILCIIEHTDSLEDIIDIGVFLTTYIHEDILELFIESPGFDKDKFIVVTTSGQLRGINSEFCKIINKKWINEEIKKLPTWQQQGLGLTNTTDAIVLKSHATHHTFTIIVSSTIYTHVDARNTVKLLTQYIRNKKIYHYQGTYHGTHYTQYTQKEHQS
ncbi:hypothetical protein KC460_01550 [Candidatus Dependentiae bacterium]|nr:hypothetical protein [Candidatus Dependentiae bacterium]